MSDSIGVRYIDKVANGNAGEFYFAYWISSNFIWPCRILDIDMGLDAQVEIYDDKNNSTGMFIGVQVKTTAKTISESPSVSVPLKNLIYWESISDPIVIVRVFLNNNKSPSLYWRNLKKEDLNEYIKKAEAGDSKSVSIKFNKSKDKLKPQDKIRWIHLFFTSADFEIISLAGRVRSELESLDESFSGDTFNERISNGLSGYQFYSELNSILNDYDMINFAVNKNPRLIGFSKEITKVIETYNTVSPFLYDLFIFCCESNSIYMDDFSNQDIINPNLQVILREHRIF